MGQQFQKITSRRVIGRFFQRLEQGPTGWVDRITFPVSSDQDSEEYGWLGMSPQMREWIGGRQAKQTREFSFTINNKDFEATLEFDTRDLRRDKSGQIMVRIDDLADRTLSHPAKLLTDLIVSGESAVAYDGQFFFDTDHTEGDSGVQSNDITFDVTTPTAPTAEEMRDAILAGVKNMYGLKDDRGEPLNENARSFDVMTPTSLWDKAVEAITLPTVSTGGANLLPNLDLTLRPVANPRLPWTDKFAIFRTDGVVAPFILQEEKPVNIDAIAEGSELEFRERKHHYGVDWAGNVGFGFWQYANLTTLT